MKTTVHALLGLLLLGCGPGDSDDDSPSSSRGCPGNANVEPASALELAAGAVTQGFICPIGNQHWFRIQVPPGQPVLTVELRNDTPLSPVKLSYTLRAADGMTPVDQPPPPASGSGKQILHYAHCVPQPGTYYLQVQSFGNDAQDTRNPFTLSYRTAADPDPGEPHNNDPAGAIALGGAEQRGYIACKGDRDFYKITLGDGALLDISLSTAAPTPGLNLKYMVLDAQMGLVAEEAVQTGMMATALRTVRPTREAGTYFVVISDLGAGSNLQVPYVLRAATFAEPDVNERPTRNDSPEAATLLGSWTCGGGASFGRMAYLASRADNDWYRINLTGVGPACQAVIDVSVSWGTGGQAVRPQVSLIYPDAAVGMYPGTACVKDEDCRFLRQDCAGDDNRCEYLGNQCDRQARKCTGAAVCLPEKFCGVLQFAKQQTTAGPASVRTAQPLVGAATYYLRIRDFESKGYDPTTPYALAVRLSTDDREPNNFYSPYQVPDNSLVRNASFAMRNKIMLGETVTSRIGYERDQDFYVFDHPCPGADCTLSVTYSTSQPSRVYHTYQVEVDGRLVAGWPAPPAVRGTAPQVTNEVFGDGVHTCFYASRHNRGPFFLWVSDLLRGGPLWDQDTTYTFTIRKVQDGCSDLCRKAPYNCGQ
ncbi:MAG: hypothetical protein RMK29_04555 [Myxococcales bacterium]|nr:hypothetical protein [Myxococcota bacterium]MDW8280960.1 hypothetical protein [Myxococcales bacterium]